MVLALDPVGEAFASGWARRKWRKVGPTEIVLAFMAVMLSSGASYSRLSRAVGIANTKLVSRQAIQKRMNKAFCNYLNRLVSKALLNGMSTPAASGRNAGGLFSAFSAVILHDSTTIALPEALAAHFPGACNGQGGRKAAAKVDTMLDIKHWRLVRLRVNPYSKNDQSQARVALEDVGKGMLLVRDLGYFGLQGFKDVDEKGAFFVSRLKYGVGLRDIAQESVNLTALLRDGESLDRWFYLGAGKKAQWVRVVAIPLPKEAADERRRKVRADRDRRSNHTEDYMRRLGWTILVTNVKENVWDTAQVAEAYGCRWFVETLFKSWKSHFNLAGQPCPKKAKAPYKREPKHPYKAEALILCMLLLALLVYMPMLARFMATPQRRGGEPEASMLQIARLVAEHCIHASAEKMAFIIESIPALCKYDTRKRQNAAQKLASQME